MFIKCAFIYLIGDGQSNESKEVTSWQRKGKKTAVFSFVLPSWSLIEHILKQMCLLMDKIVAILVIMLCHSEATDTPPLCLASFIGILLLKDLVFIWTAIEVPSFVCQVANRFFIKGLLLPTSSPIDSIYLVRFAICVFHFSWMTLLLLFAMTVAGGHLQVCPSQTSGMFISS